MRRQLELISIQHENCEVYPNILKSQDVSARSPCAPVAGQRLNKSESCVGSALHLGFERGFPSSTVQSQREVTEKQSSLQNHWQVGVCADLGVQQSALCCAGRGFPPRQANSKGKAQGNQYCPCNGGRGSSGARKLLADFQYHTSSRCRVSHMDSAPL